MSCSSSVNRYPISTQPVSQWRWIHLRRSFQTGTAADVVAPASQIPAAKNACSTAPIGVLAPEFEFEGKKTLFFISFAFRVRSTSWKEADNAPYRTFRVYSS